MYEAPHGSMGRSKAQHRRNAHHGSKTEASIEDNLTENRKTNTLKEAKKHPEIAFDIRTDISTTLLRITKADKKVSGVPSLESYVKWISDRLDILGQEGDGRNIEQECETGFVLGSGPGGQNVNKVQTCVDIIHKFTKVRFQEKGGREQYQNRSSANSRMSMLVDDHLEGWLEVISDNDSERNADIGRRLRAEIDTLYPPDKGFVKKRQAYSDLCDKLDPPNKINLI